MYYFLRSFQFLGFKVFHTYYQERKTYSDKICIEENKIVRKTGRFVMNIYSLFILRMRIIMTRRSQI
jgi:hypothetical protein